MLQGTLRTSNKTVGQAKSLRKRSTTWRKSNMEKITSKKIPWTKVP
ncbi:MAG: hypothetical protein ABIH58_02000 [Patescibacteria group bacterium]